MTGTNSSNANSRSRMIKAGLMGMVLLPFTWSAYAQQVAPAGTAIPANPQRAVPFVENSPSAPHAPGSEGITIHGHWVMDVVNRDGTVAQHRDFENALAGSQGSSVLAQVLNGTLLTQQFIVALSGGGNVAFLYVPAQSCPRFLASGSTVFCANNLTQGLLGGTSIVLKGTFTATTPVTFQTVATDVGTCPQIDPGPITYSPAVCQANTNGPIPGAGGAYVGTYNFTAATIPDLAVAAGQSVVVTVTISFS